MAFIPRRTSLEVKNMLCEVGCRQRRAMAKARILAARERRSWRQWRFKGPVYKKLDRVLSLGYTGVKLHRGARHRRLPRQAEVVGRGLSGCVRGRGLAVGS